MTHVSIVIPTLNEATVLSDTLDRLNQLDPPAWEICVVDGGSQDETLVIAKAAGVIVVETDRLGRSIQMNQGVAATTGDLICFVHADTLVPTDMIAVITSTLTDPTIAAGGFTALMTGKTTRWGISLHNWLKTYYAPLIFRPHLFFWRGMRLLFGDQVIFCRRQQFLDCQGYDPTLPIMEEADLCLKLNRYGKIRQLNRIVQTSDRRVAQWGAWKATGIYLAIGVLWGLGVSATTLKRFYEEVR
ncbi:MAG: TIGR04283 family arsenosugar biosynthesis glycosyltransferase [Elainella sp. Prado103]|jgi:rSAM/selenodomain-associated transferase 2|nr:TIGR04283 family arsenosugar biosynthesis glycosyltransferase [Elainella sp. Prado103]